MSSCPACAAPTEDGFRYCPVCGTDLQLPDSPTSTAPRPPSPISPGSGKKATGGSGGDRFVPGTVIAERYRIVGLLGRGGMGEVYRADDLKLEQTVALKFLTRGLEGDPDRLERLYAEVRTARQVSHPAVCRVWDIGEAEGQHFLSMEFVDGENLASLLRRIGRFPQDKALDVARQIAEGLAAAHAKGLLHRDLKPANVMLDGQGKVRLTDFGLAGLAESLTGEDVRSGTPSYMSPEQLAGREVSVRSDIYALGLVIYELVTGRRAFEGKSFAELTRRHRDERPLDPSALVPGLEPALERSILACLEKEPRKRPSSALVVAAMLAGRDPLEAAIAAGETPSPELVAAAGEREGLRPRAAWLCLAAVVVGVLALPALQAPRHVLTRVPVEKSPAALEDRASELLSRLRQPKPLDREIGIAYDADYVSWTEERDRSKRRWHSLASGEPPLVEFWYRQSSRLLAALNPGGRVGWNDPPIQETGMAGVRYDFRGRLLSFYVVPPQLERPSAAFDPGVSAGGASGAGPDWTPFFAEARLDPAALRRTEPLWTPPFYADARFAWEGRWPARPDVALRVEAASYRGDPVWFALKSPWTRAERDEARPLTAGRGRAQAFYILFMVALVGVGGGLAYRNISLGRGDRRSAFRLALALVTLTTLTWALRAHHVADPAAETAVFAKGAGLALLVACLVWVFYLALEPYVAPASVDARLLDAATERRRPRRGRRTRRSRRPGFWHRPLAAEPGGEVSAGARPRSVRRGCVALDSGDAELRPCPCRERDPRRPCASAAVPDPAPGDEKGLDRRASRHGLPDLRRARRIHAVEGKLVADPPHRRDRVGSVRGAAFTFRRARGDHGCLDGRHAARPVRDLRSRQLDRRRRGRGPAAAARDGRARLPQRDRWPVGPGALLGRRSLELPAFLTSLVQPAGFPCSRAALFAPGVVSSDRVLENPCSRAPPAPRRSPDPSPRARRVACTWTSPRVRPARRRTPSSPRGRRLPARSPAHPRTAADARRGSGSCPAASSPIATGSSACWAAAEWERSTAPTT